jgi:uncharacterized protein YbjQ (UPF0145 family)
MENLILFLVLLTVGYVFGRLIENGHYKSIRQREAVLRRRIPVIASKHLPPDMAKVETQLVTGNVVISVDYFKKLIAGLRNIVGGRVTSFETLIDRARREAILRMQEQARRLGANMVFNVKMETSSISKGRRGAVGSVEVLAYGTALISPRPPVA